MSKNIPQPVNPPTGSDERDEHNYAKQEPKSGSKEVKQRNHSRQNHGEG